MPPLKKSYNKGSRKALAAMVKRYGVKKGTSVFYAKANKFAKRKQSRSKKANSIYGKGSHRIKASKKK
jgi:hypothetical protein